MNIKSCSLSISMYGKCQHAILFAWIFYTAVYSLYASIVIVPMFCCSLVILDPKKFDLALAIREKKLLQIVWRTVILSDAFYSASFINFHFAIGSTNLFVAEHPFNSIHSFDFFFSWKTALFSLDIIMELWVFDIEARGFHSKRMPIACGTLNSGTVASTYKVKSCQFNRRLKRIGVHL